MALFKNILGFRDFSKIEEIKDYIKLNFPLNLSYENSEDLDNSLELLLFETTRQKTWLLCSNFRFFCILDDIAKDTFLIRWQLAKQEIIRNESLILPININPEYKKNAGLIDFGPSHKNWLYSKSLFPNANELKNGIIDLIQNKMK